jgi:hypothetical protein
MPRDVLVHGAKSAAPTRAESPFPLGEKEMNVLTEAEIEALREALDDEYRAWATYDQVIADFSEVPPFSHIRAAEARHVDALRILFARHGVPVPENPWAGRVARYGSLQEACAAGVAAEIDNAALYERLLAATQRPDIRVVFRNLQEASQQRHLRAFERCTQEATGRGSGRCGMGGAGLGQRWRRGGGPR